MTSHTDCWSRDAAAGRGHGSSGRAGKGKKGKGTRTEGQARSRWGRRRARDGQWNESVSRYKSSSGVHETSVKPPPHSFASTAAKTKSTLKQTIKVNNSCFQLNYAHTWYSTISAAMHEVCPAPTQSGRFLTLNFS